MVAIKSPSGITKGLKSMRVCIATDTFAPDHNGTATFTTNLAVAMQKSGFEIHVIAPANSKLYGSFKEMHQGIPLIVHRLRSHRLPFQPNQRFVFPWTLAKSIRNLLSIIKPEVVHIQSHLNIGHHAAVSSTNLNIRLIATNHIDEENFIENTILAPRFIKRLLARLLRNDARNILNRAEVVTATSNFAAQKVERSTGLTKVYPISSGVDTKLFAQLAKPSLGFNNLVYIGRLDHEKRVYVLIEAMSKLNPNLPVQLRIIGDGSQASELAKLVEDLDVQSKVHLLGNVSDQDILMELATSTAFVMPSTQELQSMATLEALASGRPVLAANAGVLPEIVQNGVNGFLFEPNSPSDLAKKIEDLFGQRTPDLAILSAAALKSAKKFNIGNTVKQFASVYRGEVPDLLKVEETDLSKNDRSLNNIDLLERSFVSLKRGASGVLQRFDVATGNVIESFSDATFTLVTRGRKARKRISRALRSALEQMRKDE